MFCGSPLDNVVLLVGFFLHRRLQLSSRRAESEEDLFICGFGM